MRPTIPTALRRYTHREEAAPALPPVLAGARPKRTMALDPAEWNKLANESGAFQRLTDTLEVSLTVNREAYPPELHAYLSDALSRAKAHAALPRATGEAPTF